LLLQCQSILRQFFSDRFAARLLIGNTEFSSLLQLSFTKVPMRITMFRLDYLTPMILSKLALEVVSVPKSSKPFDTDKLRYYQPSCCAYICSCPCLRRSDVKYHSHPCRSIRIRRVYRMENFGVYNTLIVNLFHLLIQKLAFLPPTRH
jgi:hypothetical protein